MTRFILFTVTCIIGLLVGSFAAAGQWLLFAILAVTMWLPWLVATLLANRLYWMEAKR